jgi:hypothetical protein
LRESDELHPVRLIKDAVELSGQARLRGRGVDEKWERTQTGKDEAKENASDEGGNLHLS